MLLKQTCWLENITLSYWWSFFYYHSKNEKIWHPPVSLSRPSGNILIFWSPFCYCFMFIIKKIYTFTLWLSTCFGCEIQTVYSCLNRSEITENWHQKLKHNRKKSVQPWQPFNWLLCYQNMLTSLFLRNK